LGLVDEFERRLERAVEGFFSRTFRSRIQPAEIGRRLLREMEAGKSVSVGAVYVPNRFVIRLSPSDSERFEGLMPTLRQEFADLLRSQARERRWRPAGRVAVEFSSDAGQPEGRFEVEGHHESSGEDDDGDHAPELRLRGVSGRSFTLGEEPLTIGRLASCHIVLDDPNASRRHAEVSRRDDGWWIVDLGSTNGTLVNGGLIKERRLENRDVVQIGSSELEFVDDMEAAGED
jgi:hypothetical protein